MVMSAITLRGAATLMSRGRSAFLAGLVLALAPTAALAVGTPACTEIENQATATYDIGSNSFTESSNTVITSVAEILDVVVTWQDASSVVVPPGSTNEALTFLVTNIGNGIDSYALAGLSVLTGDDFDPSLGNLFLDTNGNGSYDPGTDMQYVPGSNDPVIAADSSAVVFVLNDIPGGLNDGDEGDSRLTATSNTGSGTPGTSLPGAGDGGCDAVVGSTGGTDDDQGTYVVSGITVSIVKSATVSDPFGGTEPIPGAEITYTIVVDIAGVGNAENLTITDPIPGYTTYKNNTLTLDASSLTDAVDGDEGDVGVTTANTVSVFLGTVASGSPTRTITFTVTID